MVHEPSESPAPSATYLRRGGNWPKRLQHHGASQDSESEKFLTVADVVAFIESKKG